MKEIFQPLRNSSKVTSKYVAPAWSKSPALKKSFPLAFSDSIFGKFELDFEASGAVDCAFLNDGVLEVVLPADGVPPPKPAPGPGKPMLPACVSKRMFY